VAKAKRGATVYGCIPALKPLESLDIRPYFFGGGEQSLGVSEKRPYTFG
jgi:hypothetical protein